MKDSIKEISTTLLIIIIAIMVGLNYLNNSKNSLDIQKQKGIGIESRNITINILDDKILCEDIILFNISSKQSINYQFLQNSDNLKDIKIYINDRDNFYSTNLKMSLYNGSLNIDKRLLDNLKIFNNNISVKLIYELDTNFILRYKNTDVIPFYMNI